MKKLFIISGFIFLNLITIAFADFTSPLDLGYSAGNIALGRMEGFSGDATSIFGNPAGLAKIKGTSISSFKTKIIEADYLNLAAVSNGFGAGYMSTGVSGIPNTGVDNVGEYVLVKDISYTNSLYWVGYGFNFANMPMGVTLKSYSQSMGTFSGNSFNADFGLYSKIKFIDYSLVVHDFLPIDYKYSTGSTERIPIKVVNTFKFSLGDFSLYPQMKVLINGRTRNLASIGAQYKLFNMLTVNAGWREFYVVETKKSSVSAGMGLEFGMFDFGYAIENSEYDSGLNNFFSLSIKI